MMDTQLIWDEFLKLLREEAGNQVVETWFKAVRFISWNPEHAQVTLKTPNDFIARWIKDRYQPMMCKHLGRLLCATVTGLVFQKTDEATPSASPAPTNSFLTIAPPLALARGARRIETSK